MKYLEKETEFNELMQTGTVLVDFYADWCGPCQMIGPVLEEIAKEKTAIQIVKVNVDKFQNIAREYKVMSIPTLIVFKNGKEINKIIGFTSKEEITKLLEV